jgi:hypothetical protein
MQLSVTLPRNALKLDSLTIEKTEATTHHTNLTSGNCVHNTNCDKRRVHGCVCGENTPYT